MSGAARRRGGRGRATAGDDSFSDTSSRPSRGSERLRPPGGGFDGPASRGSASGAGSQPRRGSNAPSVGSNQPSGTGSPQRSQPGSRRGSVSAQPTQAATQHARDPALDPDKPLARYSDQLKNIDMPASFYNIDNLYRLPTVFKSRPGFNTSGKSVQVAINSWPVAQFPTQNIFQYDVVIGNGAEKRAVQRKVWESKVRKEKTGNQLIYDGNKLAWASKDLPELRIMVDLDAEEGRPPGRTSNAFRLSIKKTKKLDISVIASYLDGRVQFNERVLEAVNFLDHLLREGPSQNDRFVTLKRSIFIRDGQRSNLGGNVEVFRGVYQTLRLAEGKKLIINLDVANTCFWQPTSLTAAICGKHGLRDTQDLVNALKPQQDNGSRRKSDLHVIMERAFKKVLVKASYKNNPYPEKLWTIAHFRLENAREYKIRWRDPQTKQEGPEITIFEYFKRKYNLMLLYPQLPLVEMTKKNVMYPMEFLFIKENQRYPFKLDEKQTANMIKFAVSPPGVRLGAIQEGKSWLDWSKDKYLQEYGLRIDSNPIQTNARILPPPGIKFGNKIEQPGTKGRWDLRGKKFLTGNPAELVAWGIGVFPGRINVDKSQIDAFAAAFAKAYREHGGRVSNAPPNIVQLKSDAAGAVETLHQSTGNKYQRRPQLLIFLVQDKNTFHYTRIKKSCDCRYGVVSQVMQVQQVLKMNGQYFSNVLMKVNAKLGGCTSQVQPAPSSGFKNFTGPTMLIGADVSHASPGSMQASMAALTVSFDRHAGRYAAACQTNGRRVEIITEQNMRSMLGPLMTRWQSTVGGGKLPTQVYYMRDGVSEGQFLHVMEREVPFIKAILQKCNNNQPWEGKLTVVIASKRHHIRAFPTPNSGAADPKGNPLPGCLIERDCTTPNEWDFYLYSHIALQGTSRPVHYTILHDDANHQPNTIQNMIYEQCYQYMRSTTSVSLHPAVYYAHLASNRARAHEDLPASEGPQGGPGFKNLKSESSDPISSETPPLMPMYDANGIQFAMWYI